MTEMVIEIPQAVAVDVRGGGRFPVRRIFCLGQNYGAHVREMGGDPASQVPVIFTKPADTLVIGGAAMPYPPQTNDLHYEIELVVAIGTGGRDIDTASALDHVWGYAAGIDMTRRDLQAAAKKAGRPWDMAKAFDHSAPIGEIVPVAACGHPAHGGIALEVNGEVRQQGDLSEMIWNVAEIIAALSSFVALAPGDLIFTGTPAGVGPVVPGDRLLGTIEGVGEVRVTIAG